MHVTLIAMGLLPDTLNCVLCIRECRERFPSHLLQRKPPVNDHGMCVTHVPWCMSGSLNPRRSQGKRSWHSRHMCNPQFNVFAKRPIAGTIILVLYIQVKSLQLIWFHLQLRLDHMAGDHDSSHAIATVGHPLLLHHWCPIWSADGLQWFDEYR